MLCVYYFKVNQGNLFSLKKTSGVRGMYSSGLYRRDGYQKGFVEGRRTGGKLKKVYIDNFFKEETQRLSSEDSMEFKKGWQEGFTDAVRGMVRNKLEEEKFLMVHKFELV
jgi:hypothetical protein